MWPFKRIYLLLFLYFFSRKILIITPTHFKYLKMWIFKRNEIYFHGRSQVNMKITRTRAEIIELPFSKLCLNISPMKEGVSWRKFREKMHMQMTWRFIQLKSNTVTDHYINYKHKGKTCIKFRNQSSQS